MTVLLSLQRKRAGLIEKARFLLADVDKRDGVLTKNEQAEYDGLMEQIDSLAGDIERRKRLVEADDGFKPVDDGAADPRLGMHEREINSYSLRRAILAAATGNWRGAGLELEASQATAKRLNIEPNGFLVPYDWMASRSVRLWDSQRGFYFANLERRDLNVGTPTAGGNLVATDLLAESFIDLLRNQMVLQRAGVSNLDGLVGDVAIPKQTGAATAYWLSEGSAPTESQQTIGQVAVTPHTVGAFTEFTRKLLKQSSISVERMVRNDLAMVLALAIDFAGLHGDSGVDANQPDGVETFADTSSVVGGANGAAPTWGNVVGLETAVATSNADVGRTGYISSAKVRGKLKQTVKASGTAQFVWDGNEMNGYSALVTNQVRDNRSKGSGTNLSTIFFGNWADLVMAMWGGLDIMVNPYAHDTSGGVRVVALQDVDWVARHDESFAAMLDADAG